MESLHKRILEEGQALSENVLKVDFIFKSSSGSGINVRNGYIL